MPPFSLIPKLPATSAVFRLFTSVPPQVFVTVSGVATVMPGAGVVGKASIKVTAAIGTGFGLTKVKVNTVGTVVATGLGLKLLAMLGAAGLFTTKVCGVTPLIKTLNLFILPESLIREPAGATPFTVKVMVQIAPAATLIVSASKTCVPLATLL